MKLTIFLLTLLLMLLGWYTYQLTIDVETAEYFRAYHQDKSTNLQIEVLELNEIVDSKNHLLHACLGQLFPNE